MFTYNLTRIYLMPTSEYNTKDHDLLIRIEERITLLIERVANVELSIQNSKTIEEENKNRLNKIEHDMYGSKNTEGIIQKVEKHDKIILKMLAYCSVFVVIAEFLIKLFIK